LSGSFAFVFDCLAGDSGIKSALLAASLARSVRCRYELIAVRPESESPLSPVLLAFFDRLGVRRVESPRVETDCETLVLLDPSQLLLSDFIDDPRFSIGFNACSAFEPPAGDEAAWRAMYQSCGTLMPLTRIYSPYTNQYFRLFFDPGFVAVSSKIHFGEIWLQCRQVIQQAHSIQSEYDLQKVSLAVAAKKSGLEIDVLDERYNHPTWLKPLNERDLPIFARYREPGDIVREPALLRLVSQLIGENGDLRAMLADDPAWSPIAKIAEKTGVKIKTGEPLAPELIITGIPRSGTSYLCNLLHRFDNCVILNEAKEDIPILKDAKSPFAFANFLRDLRRDILSGVSIANKLENGQITQDTAKNDATQFYSPQVASANFVLGVKETLAFISRIPMLRQILPNARIVACVRNPLDTIASWKGSFPHLNIADVVRQPIGSPIDPWLTGRQQQELRAVGAIADPTSRRAAWWAYLANLILQSRDQLIIVRYEDLVTNPKEVLVQILRDWPAGVEIEPIEPSVVRQRRELLTDDDVLAVRTLCHAQARVLGLSIE
jgi:hypothetical protein